MLQTFKNGQGSVVVRAKLLDSSSTVGAGLTGLSSGSSGLIISTIADNEAAATAYTVAGSTIESITTLGTFAAPTATKCRFKEVDATNHKGLYEFQFADARFAVSSAKSLIVSVLGATNLQQADFLIQLQSDDPYVAKPTNSSLLSVDSNGRVDVIKVAGTTQTAGDLAAMITVVDDYVDTEVAAIKTQTDKMVFTVANQLDVNVIDWKGATAPAMTGDAYARLGAPAGAAISADIAAAKVDTAAIKVQTDKLTFTVANQVDSNVLDWKSATAPAMTGDAFARIGAPVGASISIDLAAVKTVADAVKAKTDNLPPDPADASDILTSTNAIYNRVGAPAGASIAADIAAVNSKTTNLPAAPAAVGDIPTAVQNADSLLNRDMATGSDTGSSTVRTVRQALRFSRNRFVISGGVLTVYKEDDSTASWTAAITTTAGNPVTASDPAGP